MKLTVREYIYNHLGNNDKNIRTLLSQFKYSEQTFHKNVVDLSEGEKMQLNLSILILKETNILLLDEPTNYLDIMSIEMLEQALERYCGTIILVTHDSTFASKIVTKIVNIET
ncbi:hypothetical protein ELUMI_v1c01600 [Williamsoniiplasma luminosum]|uniref:ABC transporter domain-containing protein n=1 Tax=Williamsoniiplasma luminosum TaxID=214888 RepID=A0A2K8NSQ6_9MOLU|nr:ATP-binding cassette domain-containing protein [Williamsoniiplasma luminosum]ATZ16885.1 hypothetical protein ELUMI_v1c01600 [Williamsoniiplasma luminosum]